MIQKINGLPWLIILLLTPIVLWILPASFFDGEGGIILCPSRFLFDIECFGCGMTRAIMHFHHFEFEDAVFYNQGSLVIYPALVIIWGIWVKNAYKKVQEKRLSSNL